MHLIVAVSTGPETFLRINFISPAIFECSSVLMATLHLLVRQWLVSNLDCVIHGIDVWNLMSNIMHLYLFRQLSIHQFDVDQVLLQLKQLRLL